MVLRKTVIAQQKNASRIDKEFGFYFERDGKPWQVFSTEVIRSGSCYCFILFVVFKTTALRRRDDGE